MKKSRGNKGLIRRRECQQAIESAAPHSEVRRAELTVEEPAPVIKPGIWYTEPLDTRVRSALIAGMHPQNIANLTGASPELIRAIAKTIEAGET